INVSKPIKNKMLLENILFKLITKSFHVLIGRNGAGKSTLMNILTGNDKNYTGDIYFKNEDIKLVKIRESCMYSNANLSFPLWWNVFEYVKNFSYFFNNKFFSNKDILTPILELDPSLNLIYTFLLLLIISITIPLTIFRSIKGEI
ncbi:ATP-binding cassette domain-containing protein, partial [Metamycoplasma hyosynoviae]|uniref:ATP-binding cassette domain-containing protein n=1 Tax=Metamycoplasma hyosynoviae TaxID=29559 RepID=UPI002358F082